MNKTCSKQRIICQSKLYLFTTKRHVSTKTPLVHLQEICSHKELRQYEITHYLFNLFSTSIQSFKPLMSWTFLLLEESNCILSPSPLKLPSSNFSMTTTHLQFINIYFTISKKHSQQWSHRTPWKQ